jgi:glyoxylase-like metal-dependent hydrolase (beta-lactamase superfamily II)
MTPAEVNRTIPGIDVVPLRRNGPRGVVKAFVLYDQSSVVLVDTGFTAGDGELLVPILTERVTAATDFTAIVLTHGHGDHTGGLQRVRADFPWKVFAHVDETRNLAADSIEPDEFISDGARWDVLGGLRFTHVPGHTAGSMAVFHEASGSLIAGDAIVSAGQHLMISPEFLCEDPAQARESVARLLGSGQDIKAVLVAHGEDVYRDAAAPLARILLRSRPS